MIETNYAITNKHKKNGVVACDAFCFADTLFGMQGLQSLHLGLSGHPLPPPVPLVFVL
jgi:hypothetical protein